MSTLARDELLAAWSTSNDRYLQTQLRRLRLLLRRRAVWLRARWREDPLQEYRGLVVSDSQADMLFAAHPGAEPRFYAEDQECVAIGDELAELERELGERAQGAGVAPPALELLAGLFRLSPFERDVLLLCLAPELDERFERLYAYVQDDVARTFPTAHLAVTLFSGTDRRKAHRSFYSSSPLLQFRLVTIDRAGPQVSALAASPLRLPPRLVEYLGGTNRLDPAVASLLLPVRTLPLTRQHTDLVESLLRAVERGAARRPGVNLVAPAASGKRAVAASLAERLGLELVEVDHMRLGAPGAAREETLRVLEREAALLRLAYYVTEPDDPHDQSAARSFKDVVDRLGPFVIVASEQRVRSNRLLPAPVPRPDAEAQRGIWEQALVTSGIGLRKVAEALPYQFDFGPTAVAGTVGAATGRAALRGTGPEGVLDEDLWEAAREQAAWRLDDLARRLAPAAHWDEIVVPSDVLAQLREISAQVAHRAHVYDDWGFGPRLSRGRGISALFAGTSGTGKTMAAEILASELGLDLYCIDLAGVVDKYIGETEKNLRSVFDAAERSGSILFFDEADALFGKRTEVKDSHDRYANIEINYLLQRMEDYPGLSILATNRRTAIDRAFLRRLRFLVDFPFPDAKSRRAIWEKVFPPEAEIGKLNFESLARLELPGGNIKTIAVNAAFLAAREGEPISTRHVMHAARREYAKLDRSLTKAEFGRYYAVGR